MRHRHVYRILSQDAKAYFRKENWPGDQALIVEGSVYQCLTCKKMMIAPNDPSLAMVEINEA